MTATMQSAYILPLSYYHQSLVSDKAVKNQPCISQAIRNSCNKQTVYRRFICNQTTANELKYTNVRNRLTTVSRHAKKNYYAYKLDSNRKDLKSTWREIKNILGKNKKTGFPELKVH